VKVLGVGEFVEGSSCESCVVTLICHIDSYKLDLGIFLSDMST